MVSKIQANPWKDGHLKREKYVLPLYYLRFQEGLKNSDQSLERWPFEAVKKYIYFLFFITSTHPTKILEVKFHILPQSSEGSERATVRQLIVVRDQLFKLRKPLRGNKAEMVKKNCIWFIKLRLYIWNILIFLVGLYNVCIHYMLILWCSPQTARKLVNYLYYMYNHLLFIVK